MNWLAVSLSIAFIVAGGFMGYFVGYSTGRNEGYKEGREDKAVNDAFSVLDESKPMQQRSSINFIGAMVQPTEKVWKRDVLPDNGDKVDL